MFNSRPGRTQGRVPTNAIANMASHVAAEATAKFGNTENKAADDFKLYHQRGHEKLQRAHQHKGSAVLLFSGTTPSSSSPPFKQVSGRHDGDSHRRNHNDGSDAPQPNADIVWARLLVPGW